jgi:hypothetical protein
MSKIKLEPLKLPELKKRKRTTSSSSSSKSIQLINNIKDIAKNFIKKSITYEVCGTFNLDSNDNIINYSFNPNFYSKSTLDKSRNYCTYDNLILSSKIWHTHPDKYYPSNEDIFKIFKKKIKESYIISRYGYFKISFNNHINDLKEFKIENIDKYVSEFYFSTNKGRDYNKDAINKLCKKINIYINNIIENKYLISEKFKISFYLYY